MIHSFSTQFVPTLLILQELSCQFIHILFCTNLSVFVGEIPTIGLLGQRTQTLKILVNIPSFPSLGVISFLIRISSGNGLRVLVSLSLANNTLPIYQTFAILIGKTGYQSFNLCFSHYESGGVSFNMSKNHLGFFFCDYSSSAHFATKLLIFFQVTRHFLYSRCISSLYVIGVLNIFFSSLSFGFSLCLQCFSQAEFYYFFKILFTFTGFFFLGL